MKLSINQSELANALNVASKGASSRSTLPILSGILLKARGDSLTLEATNLDLSIRCSVAALVEEEGESVIPSKLLLDVIKSLPNSAVQIKMTDDTASILCETSSFNIRTLIAQDFPSFPEVSPDTSITVPFDLFSDMAKRVSKVVSRDESRPVLTGVLVESEGNLFRMVATDSYRLAFSETRIRDAADFSAVVAGSFLANVSGLSASGKDIEFGVSENQIVVKCGSTTFVNRRIEGQFPRYGQLLPDQNAIRARFRTRLLADAVKRAALMNDKTNPIKFDLNLASQTVQVSTSSQDVGEARETIGSAIEGEDVVIGFNPSYVLDGLGSVDDDEVMLELQSSVRPGILKTDAYYNSAELGKERFAYVIMPVRLI